jgi:hypothetical protein
LQYTAACPEYVHRQREFRDRAIRQNRLLKDDRWAPVFDEFISDTTRFEVTVHGMLDTD